MTTQTAAAANARIRRLNEFMRFFSALLLFKSGSVYRSIRVFIIPSSRCLQDVDPGLPAALSGLVVPYGGLDLADVSVAHQQHAETALSDAAADGEGELASEQRLMEGELAPLLAASDLQLPVEGFGTDADAHAGELEGTAEHLVVEQYIAVEVPVVVVRSASVVRLAALQGSADLGAACRSRSLSPWE